MVLGSAPLPGMVLMASRGAVVPVSNVMLNSGNAWCTTNRDQNETLLVDFGKERRVNGLAVQGDPTSDKWVESFQLEYAKKTQMFQTYPATGTVKVCILRLRLHWTTFSPKLVRFLFDLLKSKKSA